MAVIDISLRQSTVRLAVPEDNEALLALSRICPMEGALTLYIDRAPDYLELYRLLDAQAQVLVEEAEAGLAGTLGTLHSTVYLDGQPYSAATLRDFKVAPEYRKGRTGFRLVRHMIDLEIRRGTRFVMATFLDENRRALTFAQGRAGIPAGVYCGDYLVHNVVPLRRIHPSPVYRVTRMLAKDLPEVVTLLNQHNTSYQFGLRFTEDSLRSLLTTLSGLSMQDVLVVRKGAVMVGALASWDARSLLRYVVLSYTWRISLLRMLFRLSRWRHPVSGIPKAGEPLSFRYVMFVAIHAQEPEVLRTLLGELQNSVRNGGYTHFTLCLHERDRLNQALNGLTKITTRSQMYVFSNTPDAAESLHLSRGVPYAAFSLFL